MSNSFTLQNKPFTRVPKELDQQPHQDIPKCLHQLATPKNSGLLILIDKLLTKENSARVHRLAEKLLNNFNTNSIDITSSPNDNPITFVSRLIEEAKMLLSNSNDHNQALYVSAEKLVHSVENVQKNNQERDPNLEKNWKEFSLQFLQNKLNFLLYR